MAKRTRRQGRLRFTTNRPRQCESRVRDARTTYRKSFQTLDGGGTMVAFNRVRCTVLAVSELQKSGMSRGAIVRDVLPWADPYVAQLIKKLQDEARAERRVESKSRLGNY